MTVVGRFRRAAAASQSAVRRCGNTLSRVHERAPLSLRCIGGEWQTGARSVSSCFAIEGSMKKVCIRTIACILLGAVIVHPALAGNVIVGVNTVGAQLMNEQQQDALIEQLRRNGVKT